MSKLNLKSPALAHTESSAAIVWDKLDEADSYKIYLDGALYDECEYTDYTVTGLDAYSEYRIKVSAVCEEKEIDIEEICVGTGKKGKVLDVCDFGAVGDGKTLNTKAIQSAIDKCSKDDTVYIGEGTYLSGALFLKSDMTLYIDKGATLMGSDDPADYPIFKYRFEGLEEMCYASLINTTPDNSVRNKNISICGKGVINANGSALKKAEISEKAAVRGRAVCLRNTDNIYLYGITIRQSPAWCLHIIYSSEICLNDVEIYTRHDENGNIYDGIINGDGFDPDSSKNIYVFNSYIASQDDCIAIKSGKNEEGRKVGISSENIRITNTRFKGGFGVAVGSEMSGSVRNVLVQDCTFIDSFSIASIKPPRGRGGVVENIRYENCVLKNTDKTITDCEWFRGALYADNYYSHKEFDVDDYEEINEGTPLMRNICFENIYLETVGGNAIYLAGVKESPMENIILRNIEARGKYGMKAYNVKGLTLDNVEVISENDEDYMFNNVKIK